MGSTKKTFFSGGGEGVGVSSNLIIWGLATGTT